MYKCVKTQNIWEKFRFFVENCMNIEKYQDLSWGIKSVILGSIHLNPHHVVNFLTTVIKQRIYANKCLGEDTRFRKIVEKFEEIYNIEKHNAILKLRTCNFIKKWAPYDNQLLQTSEDETNVQNIISEYIAIHM